MSGYFSPSDDQLGNPVHTVNGHTMVTWRALVPSLLEWMTPLLTEASQHPVPVSQVGTTHVSRKDRHRRAGVSQAARGSVPDTATASPPA
jgi:hypothetical protein